MAVRTFCYFLRIPRLLAVLMLNSNFRLSRDLPIATIGTVAEKVISLAAMALLAQYYAPDKLGSYLVILSITSLSALLADLGTNKHLLRATSTKPESAGRYLGEILSLRVPALVGVLALTCLGIYTWQPSLLLTTVYLSIFVFGRELYYAFGAVMLALGNVRGRILSGLSGPVFLVAAIYVSARRGLSFEDLMMLHAFAGIIMLAVGWAAASPDLGSWKLGLDRQRIFALVTISQPLFLLSLLEGGLARSGEILIASFGDLESVAEYGLGYRIVEASRFVIRPLSMVLFPLLVSTAACGNWSAYNNYLRLLAALSILIGAVIGIAFGTQADVILANVFGAQYAAATPLFRVFALIVPFVFLLTAELLLLTSLHLERSAVKFLGIGLAFNVVVSSVAIPRYGAYGAAWSIATVNIALCILLAILIFGELKYRRGTFSLEQKRTTRA